MTTAIAERPIGLPKDQLELVRRTVAAGATNDELALFLYDCERRGIHPLDKLLHFTKRGGKYTPVTSIDYMRSQAASSGEMAGNDDPVFKGDPEERTPPTHATVTVYRFTQGHRFPYTATARWAEYCPDNAQMWRKMPHTMLGKCAEALALRKAFPQQLAGLYSREEMEQADGPKGYVVEPPPAVQAGPQRVDPSVVESDVRPVRAEVMGAADFAPVATPDVLDALPDGAVVIERVEVLDTRNKNVKKCVITVSSGETYSTIKGSLASLAEQFCQNRTPVYIEGTQTKWGTDATSIIAAPSKAEIDATKFQYPDNDAAPLTDEDIPF